MHSMIIRLLGLLVIVALLLLQCYGGAICIVAVFFVAEYLYLLQSHLFLQRHYMTLQQDTQALEQSYKSSQASQQSLLSEQEKLTQKHTDILQMLDKVCSENTCLLEKNKLQESENIKMTEACTRIREEYEWLESAYQESEIQRQKQSDEILHIQTDKQNLQESFNQEHMHLQELVKSLELEQTRIQELQEKLQKMQEDETHAILQLGCVWELLEQPLDVLRELREEIPNMLAEFQECLNLLQLGTLSRALTQELNLHLERTKNKAQILRLQSLLQSSEKITTLLQIFRHTQGTFRIEQVLEVHQEIRKFVTILQTYQNILDKIVHVLPLETPSSHEEAQAVSILSAEDEPSEEIMIDDSVMENMGKPLLTTSMQPSKNTVETELALMARVYDSFTRAVFTSSAYPSELVRFIRQCDELWDRIFSRQKSVFMKLSSFQKREHVFSLADLLEKTLGGLRSALEQRNLICTLSQKVPVIFIHGDSCKIANLLMMFFTASLWRAEPSSSIKLQWTLASEPSGKTSIKISTVVAIRNTDAKTIEKLTKWRHNVQPYCREANVYLTTDKWGFTLEIPNVLNPDLPEKMFIFSHIPEEVQSTLIPISSYFPFPWEVKNLETLQNKDVGIIVTDMENLSNPILQNSNNPKILVAKIEDLLHPSILSSQFAYDCLRLPLHPSDLKFSLLRCFDYGKE